MFGVACIRLVASCTFPLTGLWTAAPTPALVTAARISAAPQTSSQPHSTEAWPLAAGAQWPSLRNLSGGPALNGPVLAPSIMAIQKPLNALVQGALVEGAITIQGISVNDAPHHLGSQHLACSGPRCLGKVTRRKVPIVYRQFGGGGLDAHLTCAPRT